MNRVFLAALSKLKSTATRPAASTLTLKYNFNNTIPGQFYCSRAEKAAEDDDGTVNEGKVEEKADLGIASSDSVNTKEPIKDRLLRLSMESPDEFIPSASMEVAEKQRWERYSKCFPDQTLRSNSISSKFNEFRSAGFSNPNRESSYRNPNHRPAYNRSGYSSDENYNPGRNYYPNKYENRYDLPPQMNNRRYNGRFEDDYVPTRQEHGFSKPRGSHRGISKDEDEDGSSRIDYRQMQKDYDLDELDLPEEPRQSSQIRFSNEDNQSAIKEAYMRRYRVNDSGSKREFHTYAPLFNLQSIRRPDDVGDKSLMKEIRNSSDYSKKRSWKKGTSVEDVSTAVQQNRSDFFGRDSILDSNADPEVFGSLSKSKSQSMPSVRNSDSNAITTSPDTIYSEEEEDDVSFSPEVRMSMRKLEIQTKELLNQKKLTEALDLFTGTVKEGGFRYTLKELAYIYRIMIAECAKAGYVQLAHKLYIRMIKRGLYVLPGVYTSLFNACGNSSWAAEKNIELMDRLREQMRKKGYLPNLVNYHAMIKGYGRCGSIEKAFAVVDEMLSRKDENVRPNAETFLFLLQACITDKTNGFRNALFTWNKMNARRIRPNAYSYHLLLKATRECGVSIPEDIEKQIKRKNEKLQTVRALLIESNQEGLLPGTKTTFDPDVEKSKYLLSGSLTENSLSRIKGALEIISSASTTDLQIMPSNHNSGREVGGLSEPELETIERLRFPHIRLLMLGGLRGILQQMREDNIVPDIKIIQELLMLVSVEESLDVMQLLDSYRVQPDIQLYNVLVKKFSTSSHPEEARRVLQLINERRLNPDIYTWSALALGCRTWQSAKLLLSDMEISKVTPNIVMLTSLLTQATRYCDPHYVVMVMNEITKRDLPLSPKTLEIIEKFRNNMRKAVIQAEKKEPITVHRMASILKHSKDQFLDDFRIFNMKYDGWLRRAHVDIEPDDPWADDFASRFPRRDFGRKQENPQSGT